MFLSNSVAFFILFSSRLTNGSSNITKGHRFLGQSEFEVNSLEDYLTKLEENFAFPNIKILKKNH